MNKGRDISSELIHAEILLAIITGREMSVDPALF